MATLLRTDGTQQEVQPRNGSDFELDELQAYVGGYIEIVRIGENELMVVNEEGKLLGLPVNDSATDRIVGDTIVGDALVCKAEEVL